MVAILTFHFNLVHVSGTHHGPDGLSRRPHQNKDDEEKDDEVEINQLCRFMHQINVVVKATLTVLMNNSSLKI
jgi:hypothetical protein